MPQPRIPGQPSDGPHARSWQPDPSAGLSLGGEPHGVLAARGGAGGARLVYAVAGVVIGVLLGAATSVLTTSLAAEVAGRQADGIPRSPEFTIRVGLILAAPCMGAILAALFAGIALPHPLRAAPWAIGLGTVTGPILALRRIR